MASPNEFARHYLEDLISFFGLNTKVEDNFEEGTVELKVPSTRLNGFLIGQRGQNLRAIQHLTNMAIRSAGFEEVTVVIDVANYKEHRNQRLARKVQGIAADVAASGSEHKLEPMSAYERRVVHKAIGESKGVTSESTGEGRERQVVIKPTNDAASKADEE